MDIQRMMQQAQEMQSKMEQLQSQLSEVEVEGTSGGGMVRVVMSCKGEVSSINIDQSLIESGDKEAIEDLTIAAINNARAVADDKIKEETQRLMGNMGLPTGI